MSEKSRLKIRRQNEAGLWCRSSLDRLHGVPLCGDRTLPAGDVRLEASRIDDSRGNLAGIVPGKDLA
jgi:hypothetical protein